MQVIIYPNDDTICVVIPASDNIIVDDVAKRDVPIGVPYLIIDSSELPSDRYFRDAWEADFTNPDGYGIGVEAWENLKRLEDLSDDQN